MIDIITTLMFVSFLMICPYWLIHIGSSLEMMAIQAAISFLGLDILPANVILFRNFPAISRATYSYFLHALSRATMYTLTTVAFIYLIDLFGFWGIYTILLPLAAGFGYAIKYFSEEEIAKGYATKNEIFIFTDKEKQPVNHVSYKSKFNRFR